MKEISKLSSRNPSDLLSSKKLMLTSDDILKSIAPPPGTPISISLFSDILSKSSLELDADLSSLEAAYLKKLELEQKLSQAVRSRRSAMLSLISKISPASKIASLVISEGADSVLNGLGIKKWKSSLGISSHPEEKLLEQYESSKSSIKSKLINKVMSHYGDSKKRTHSKDIGVLLKKYIKCDMYIEKYQNELLNYSDVGPSLEIIGAKRLLAVINQLSLSVSDTRENLSSVVNLLTPFVSKYEEEEDINNRGLKHSDKYFVSRESCESLLSFIYKDGAVKVGFTGSVRLISILKEGLSESSDGVALSKSTIKELVNIKRFISSDSDRYKFVVAASAAFSSESSISSLDLDVLGNFSSKLKSALSEADFLKAVDISSLSKNDKITMQVLYELFSGSALPLLRAKMRQDLGLMEDGDKAMIMKDKYKKYASYLAAATAGIAIAFVPVPSVSSEFDDFDWKDFYVDL